MDVIIILIALVALALAALCWLLGTSVREIGILHVMK